MRQKRDDQTGSAKPNLVDRYSKIGIGAVAAAARYQVTRSKRRKETKNTAERTDKHNRASVARMDEND